MKEEKSKYEFELQSVEQALDVQKDPIFTENREGEVRMVPTRKVTPTEHWEAIIGGDYKWGTCIHCRWFSSAMRSCPCVEAEGADS